MANIAPHTGILGNRLAAHLLRRTTFGPTKAQILDYATKTPQQAVNLLLAFTPINNLPIDPVQPNANPTWVETVDVLPGGTDDVGLRSYIFGWMLNNFRTDNSIRSKMILFLHQNWMVDDQTWQSHNLYDYLKLLEYYSLGSYKSLAKKMCRDNRMLVYLTGYDNTGTNPNENYGREFLELFTIGKGPQIGVGNYTNYTEEDVKAASKIFSGYQYDLNNAAKDPDTNIRICYASPWRHSTVAKVFSAGLSGGSPVSINSTNNVAGMATEIDQFVNLVFDRLETAKNISRKLYRYFLHRDINADVETNIIGPMATALKNNNYNLTDALSLLLQSQHFYDLDDANSTDNKIGAMLKSPLDSVMHAIRFFNISPFTFSGNTPFTIWDDFYGNGLRDGILSNAGMDLFNTTTVAGFPAYYLAPLYDKLWFDTSKITQRYYLGKILLENKRWPYSSWASMGIQIDIVTWVRNNISNPANGNTIVDELVNFLLPEIPDSTRRAYFLNQTLLGTLSLINWQNEWNNYISTNNTSVVKPRLELLFRAILYAQEYQLQ